MIGQLLDGRYQIIRVLGAGGFGHTYIAEDTRIPGNPVCVVKHLKPASSDPSVLQTARRLFKSEAEILAQIGNHPQIPRLLAYFEENQEFYLVQEFIDGHLLTAELLPGQPWTEARVIELLQDILGILNFVHRQGVIHRDVKPGNLIRRDSDRRLVLIDFGAIKQVQTHLATASTGATVAIGTPGYMPTEQGRGKPRPNSDIYALGIIGIQALTGLQPTEFPEDPDTGEIVWQNLVRVNPRLAAVLTKMTHYHFKDRYQTASEALQAVQQLGHARVTTQPDTSGYTPTEAISEGYTPPQSYLPPTTPVAPISQPRRSGWRWGWLLILIAGLTAAMAAVTATSPSWWRRIGFNSQRSSPETTSSTEICTVAIAQLNIRSTPGGDVIDRLEQGTSVTLSGKRENIWVEISAPRSGWVGSRDKQGKKLINCPSESGNSPEIVPPPVPSPNSNSDDSAGDNRNKTPRRKKKKTQQPPPTPVPTPTPTLSPIPTDSPAPTPTPTETPIPTDTPAPSESPIPIEVPAPIETLPPTPVESSPATETPIPSESPIP